MLKAYVSYLAIIATSFALMVSCANESLETLKNYTPPGNNLHEKPDVAKILEFSSAKEVAAAVENYTTTVTRSNEGFTSYLETVMSEPGYEDLPYAILSEAFGAILNKDGELVFADNLLHVSKYGLLYGPVEKSSVIRSLANGENLLELCTEHCFYAPLSNSQFFKINGYDDIFLYDTFNMLNTNNAVETRTDNMPLAGSLNEVMISSTSMGFRVLENSGVWRYTWDKIFEEPGNSVQKQKFSDGNHCNDTKIYHQDYAIATDTGFKSRTMKKRSLGYWDTVSGDMEAGIIELSVLEELPEDMSFPSGAISNVTFKDKSFSVLNIWKLGQSVNSVLSSTSATTIDNLVSTNNVDAVRYIVDKRHAVTIFPYQIKKKNTEKITMGFKVPFGGSSKGTGYINGSFHVIHQRLYGLTVRNNEIRGTVLIYNY